MPSRKELLRAAKADIASKLEAKIEACEEKLADLDEQLFSQLPDCDRDRLLEAHSNIGSEMVDAESKLLELGKKKSLKKKIKSSLEWKVDGVNLRKEARERQKVTIRDNDALRQVRDIEAQKRKIQAGVWLYEGALVKHRDIANALIVISVRGRLVDCLDGSIKRVYRATALRPFDLDA
jgi:hypothetical protein|tara:strand:- start:148 stop:684 length:537 start_codon:yes stop_codon:yes gene_type:complete